MPPPRTKGDVAFSQQVLQTLADQHAVASLSEQKRIIEHLSHSLRLRQASSRKWSRIKSADDIIGLIQVPRDAGDLDEAIWRSFLAAHFGRASAEGEKVGSASDFLCAFGAEPFWTWQRVRDNPAALHRWLSGHKADLQTLAYGNHRKYESKQAGDIWDVIESFLVLAKEYGGPAGLVTTDPALDAGEQFDSLYRRLNPLVRFGRTGWFDLLGLLIDLKLISAEPASCYLRGATGPLKGARRLWGKRTIGELDYLAADLAVRLGISPMALEDALCNWQK